MNKRKIERSSAGITIKYKKAEKVQDICIGCPYYTYCYKYLNPELCKTIKDDIYKDFEKKKPYHSPPEETVTIVRVLCGHGKTTEGQNECYYYRYYRVKSILDINGFRIISKRTSTQDDWINYELNEQRKFRMKFPDIHLVPPANPWK